MELEDYKTMCCMSTWTRLSRCNFVCDKCKEDVTMEVVLVGMAELEDAEI